MAGRGSGSEGNGNPGVAPVLWHALAGARDAALAAGASPEAALEAARQLALAAFPALPRTHLRDTLDALVGAPASLKEPRRHLHGPGQSVTFRLTPIRNRRWHADWLGSRHAGPCLVGASGEDQARRLAARRFRAPVATPLAGDPWGRPDLVRAEVGGRLPSLPHGVVVPVVGRMGASFEIG